VIYRRFLDLALPYWREETNPGARDALLRLGGILVLTLGTTGISVWFSYLGRDFFNFLSEKDVEGFYHQLRLYLVAISVGVPVFVLRDFYTSRLQLEWRQWMTESLVRDYLGGRAFYRVQVGGLVDNPDQRLASDVSAFTGTALDFTFTLVNCALDLVSFSSILFSIYPPLFIALLVYSLGGTYISVQLGRPLVGLNFQQEKREADFRYGLVRVRENAESVAFYGGEGNELEAIRLRLAAALENLGDLLVSTRNLGFLTSYYRYLIVLLPAAVVAPLYFRGEIEFGVVNQGSSAFQHILGDVSLVVYQFGSIAGFSAVVDRLGEFSEVLERSSDGAGTANALPAPVPSGSGAAAIEDAALEAAAKEALANAAALEEGEPRWKDGNEGGDDERALGGGEAMAGGEHRRPASPSGDTEDEPAGPSIRVEDSARLGPLLAVEGLSLETPESGLPLVQDLDLELAEGESLLVMGPSGTGKTSLLRAAAGLWRSGEGLVQRRVADPARLYHDVFFVPQRPYMVLGSLRRQLMYPTWAQDGAGGGTDAGGGTAGGGERPPPERPSDADLEAVLGCVRLGPLLQREGGLDAEVDWSGVLSLGEQQRLAFARLLLARPRLAVLDESTSALDLATEERLYRALAAAGVTCLSVGHRPSLRAYHARVLELAPGGAWALAPASPAPSPAR